MGKTKKRGGAARDEEPASTESEESEDGMCDYEKLRLQNIRKNHSVLRSLGLPCKLPAQRKKAPCKTRRGRGKGGRGRGKRRKVCSDSESSSSSDSDSSEEEWQPWMEDVKKRGKGRGMKRMPPLDEHVKEQIFIAATTEIEKKFKALKEGKGKKSVACGREKKAIKSTVRGMELFPSSDEEEEENTFMGFTQQEILETGIEVCGSVPSAVTKEWVELFGEDGDTNEEFTGFTRAEILSTAIPDGAEFESVSGRRAKAKVCYQEEVISDDDEYLFCEDCMELHHGDCPVHGALQTLPDKGNDQNSLQYTKLPVPAQLTVKSSSILGAGLGVFATDTIPRGVRFGAYMGKKVPASHVDEDYDTSYMWEIKQEGVKSFYIDGRDELSSNWLRFINCARTEEEQNIVAFQFHGKIYYRTFRAVYPGNELLVWYGEEYAKDLGIAVENSGIQANHVCKGCGDSFIEKWSFDTHLKHSRQCAEANPQTFTCGKCQQRFSELCLLQLHIQRHEEYDKENVYCTNETDDLHVDDVSFYDDPLPLRTSGKKSRYGSKTSWVCQYCGKECTTGSYLRTHLRTHTGDKPFKCEHCGKCFNQHSNLRTHIRTHTGDKPFKCEHCGKCFNQHSSLRTHIRTHTGDKPFKCEHCGKCFKQHEHLRTHIRTHTGEKPFKCEHCGKCFNQHSSLCTHIRTHTGDRPYKCEYCSNSFAWSSTLKYHKQSVHSNVIPQS